MSDDTHHIPAAAADLLISQPDDPTTAVVDLAAAAGGDRRGRIRARGMRELSWTMDAPCVRPYQPKLGSGAPASTIELHMRSRATNAVDYGRALGYLWSHRALTAKSAVLGRLWRQDAKKRVFTTLLCTPIMIVG